MLGGSARGREWAGGPAKPRTLHTRRARRGQASCGELTLRDSRREQQAGAGTVPEQRDEAQPEAGHRAGSLSGGHGWECWRRGGAAEQKGKGSLFFWSFAKPTVKSEQSPRPLSLLGEVPQSTIRFRNSLEGFTEHTVGCYTRGYGLQQGRDTD